MTEIIKKIYIDGMTCAHCENKIEMTLSKTPGVLEAKVSYNNGTALVAFDGDVITYAQVKAVISGLDYAPKDEAERQAKPLPAWARILGVLAILLAGYFIFNQLGIFDFANVFPTAGQGTALGMLFVIGLLTSVHCIAMCGGINISQCVNKGKPQDNARQPAKDGAEETVKQAQTESKAPAKSKINVKTFRSSFLYNLGRVISYTVIGFIVGALGMVLTFSDVGRGVVAIIAGIFMIIMGLNMLGAFPFLRKLTPRMPKFFAKFVDKQKEKNNSPLIVGLLNGLMPCGPLQTMQIYALSTGSPWLGALSMFLFSLGTVPLMFAVGALSSILTKKFTKRIMAVSAALVIVMGMFMFNNGTALSGLPMPEFLGGTGTVVESVIDYDNNIQTVSFDLKSNSYTAIKIKNGIPVVWIIKAESSNINSCNNEIKVTKLGITKKLEVGDNIIEFTPDKTGTIPYSCWMGMIKSKIIIIS